MSVVHRLIRARRSRSRLVRRAALELLALYGIDWHHTIEVGPRLSLQHRALGTMVHPHTRIGADVTLYQGVMLGRDVPWLHQHDERPCVIVEDGAVICTGAVVAGSPERPVIIGRDTVIGANAVLTRSTGVGEVWAGNPARCVARRDEVEARALGLAVGARHAAEA
ncbi:DapH/DapD/GlmU-related protein [Actinomycetospora termitidis]|uniref:DapH/DapD/GlmU-related protein n=1 Tax=Actinomycetospora termitidis TaxID=3053470 RepID=A0ABT7M5Z4_9PSEU|nr:DapH/DapD/GlmU-related protein [Actinomycetospora sp. Odt1-22]MDL5155876.1 DapH/DapD/GlmU-related protein [Actinomycetospora sp. Odt1-22]